MKTLYLIGGTMGVGKTTVSQQLKRDLHNSVFLDGDWGWNASPFQVNYETKAMAVRNICYLLNSFIHCSAYENVIFCWIMHEQSIIDGIISKLETEKSIIKSILTHVIKPRKHVLAYMLVQVYIFIYQDDFSSCKESQSHLYTSKTGSCVMTIII